MGALRFCNIVTPADSKIEVPLATRAGLPPDASEKRVVSGVVALSKMDTKPVLVGAATDAAAAAAKASVVAIPLEE